MNMSQKLRVGAAAVVLIAACSDQGSTPVAPVARATTPFGVGAGNPADQGTVTIKRTIEIRDPDQTGVAVGAPARMVKRERTTSLGSGRTSIRREDERVRAALQAKPAAAPSSIDDLPVSGLTFPAGRPSLRESIQPWTRSMEDPADHAGVIHTSGVGDAPASVIRYVKNGATIVVVEQEWEFWKGQWTLLRRVTATPDGSVRTIVDVTRSGHTGNALESPGQWSRRNVGVVPGAPAFDMFGDAGEDCDSCWKLRLDAEKALAVAIAKDALAVIACAFAPVGFTIPVCFAALGVATEATINAVAAALELIHCENNKQPCPAKKPPTTDCLRSVATGYRLAPSFECGAPADGGVGTGGSGGPSGPSAGHYECTYYYEYDLYTGDVTYSVLLYCAWFDGP